MEGIYFWKSENEWFVDVVRMALLLGWERILATSGN
jgi:hypothetical protein